MRGVILDYASLAAADLDTRVLDAALPHWQRHAHTRPEQTTARIAGAEVVLTNKVVLTEAHFAASPALRLVVIMATGTNNVDLAAARQHGVAVCNVAHYSTPSVVQYTFAALLGLRTRLAEYQGAVRHWPDSPIFSVLDFPIEEVAGSRLGIVGYGTIGRAVAAVATALGMQVCVAESLSGRADDDGPRLPLPDLLAQVDALSLHCPLTERSRGLINAQALALMKPTAVLINAARGGIVDEQALADALRAGRLAGAAVDVLTAEPPPVGHPLLAGDIPNLLLTPHIAWAGRQSRQRLVDRMAAIITAFRAGHLESCVNGLAVVPACR